MGNNSNYNRNRSGCGCNGYEDSYNRSVYNGCGSNSCGNLTPFGIIRAVSRVGCCNRYGSYNRRCGCNDHNHDYEYTAEYRNRSSCGCGCDN